MNKANRDQMFAEAIAKAFEAAKAQTAIELAKGDYGDCGSANTVVKDSRTAFFKYLDANNIGDTIPGVGRVISFCDDYPFQCRAGRDKINQVGFDVLQEYALPVQKWCYGD